MYTVCWNNCDNIGQLSLIIMQFIICNYTCYNYNNLHVIICVYVQWVVFVLYYLTHCKLSNTSPSIFCIKYHVSCQECMMESAKERERGGKRPRVNEIFILLTPSSGYTIFKP